MCVLVLLLYSHIVVFMIVMLFCFFFFKQKTAYEMRISDWSSDVCSSDLSSAAALTGLELLLKDEVISPDETVALIATSNGYKELASDEIGRASCRERVCQYV